MVQAKIQIHFDTDDDDENNCMEERRHRAENEKKYTSDANVDSIFVFSRALFSLYLIISNLA